MKVGWQLEAGGVIRWEIEMRGELRLENINGAIFLVTDMAVEQRATSF